MMGLSRLSHCTRGTTALERSRLVVLVDGETASGAEAIAAAVQDQRRGLVLGSRTGGVARIRQVHEVGGGAMIFTIGRLLRASGEPIDGTGVTPDASPEVVAGTLALRDVPCPRFASPAPVGTDPLVAAAVRALREP